MSFFDELKRRNVFKVGAAYVAVAWLLLQVTDVILSNNEAPAWVFNTILLVLAIGLPLILLFAWAYELTPEGLRRERESDGSHSAKRVTSRRLDIMIIGVMALALAYFAFDKFMVSPDRVTAGDTVAMKTGDQQPASAPNIAIEGGNSIAVLPFVNMSSDPEQEYFADGISEEILNSLAQVDELKVAGRTSSFAFKGKNDDLLAIGKVLRVNHILEGSVRKSGNRVRITAQLIKVDDGFHMWSETWDREMADIFVIQDEISAAILAQLKTQLLGEPPVSVQTDTKTYELYLLAKQRIYERNKASLEMAEKLLSEAIAIDPVYAPAFAQLGITYMLLSESLYGSMPATLASEKAKINLDKALQLDPENAEALAGMGLYVYSYEFDYDKSIKFLHRAMAINPSLIDASTWLALGLAAAGRLQESTQLLEQTFKRDPLHRPTFGSLQRAYTMRGQNDKALEMLDSLQAYLPGDAQLLGHYGLVYMMIGKLAESQQSFQQAHEKEPLDSVNRFWYGIAWIYTQQYEYAAKIAPDHIATLALSRLGQMEEAVIRGNRVIGNGGFPGLYFQVLAENGRFSELIQALESHWQSLDDFSRTWPGNNGFGYDIMGFFAQAYRELGDEEKFADAMQRFKTALDAQVEEGADNWLLHRSQAFAAVLVGDYNTAISMLEKAFQQGGYIDTANATAWPVFKVLDGDPRYEAAKAAMNARLQEELKKIELLKGSGSVTQQTTQSNDITVAE